jgi:N12 class adenine-specific DNA methylase
LVRIEKDEAKLKGLINVRDAVIEVFNIQYIGGSDEALKEAQTKLNKTYDEFVKMVETHKSPNFIDKNGHKNFQHNEQGKKKGWYNPETDWDDEDGYSFTTTEFS